MAQCQIFLPKSKFCQHQQKTLEKQKLNFSRSALFHMKTRVYLKCFVHIIESFRFCCIKAQSYIVSVPYLTVLGIRMRILKFCSCAFLNYILFYTIIKYILTIYYIIRFLLISMTKFQWLNGFKEPSVSRNLLKDDFQQE